jgi:REP element-mobilizing transposase RayT
MDQRITYHFVWGPIRYKSCLTGEAARRLREVIRETAEMCGRGLIWFGRART